MRCSMNSLDIKTKLFLCVNGYKEEQNKEYVIGPIDKKMFYIFDNYSDFKNYFEDYLIDINEGLIDLSIIKKLNNGKIIASKVLCNHIITKLRIDNVYLNLTKEEIEDIHAKKKITPLEKVKEWEAYDICAPGDNVSSTKDRCHYFEYNCHDCLVEYASKKSEYDELDLKVINVFDDTSNKILKKVMK